MHYNELNECRLVAILMYQNFRYKGKDEERPLAALVECHRNRPPFLITTIQCIFAMV
jgi:hypothetical protein